MSLPSDVTPDIPPFTRPPAKTNRLNAQQVGLAAAALVAFLGITYIGPAITRLTRKPNLKERMQKRLQQTKRNTDQARQSANKRMREFGGRTRRWI